MVNRRTAAKALILYFGLQSRRTSHARVDRKASLEADLKRARARFDDQKKKIKKQILTEFDREIRGVAMIPDLTEGTRADRRRELAEARDAFDRHDSIPSGDRYDDLAHKFAEGMDANYAACDKAATVAIEEASRKQFPELVDLGRAIRDGLARDISAVGKLSSGAMYHGTLFHPDGRTLPYRIHIFRVGDGGSFQGHVEDDFGRHGNWSFDVEGQSNGAAYEYRLTKGTRGDFTNVRAKGFLCGTRLFGKVCQSIRQGPPNVAKFTLRRMG